MAGHSRWKNIKHRKAASDARRGKAWSRCVKAVMVAARGGGADPASNLALRTALDDARYHNVPRDTLERAIKKATGELDGPAIEAVRYEAFGPGGAAVVIDAATDNRTRTVSELRLIFSKHGGNLGATGSVAYLFRHAGIVEVRAADDPRVMEAAVAAGATDLTAPEAEGETWAVETPAAELALVRESLAAAGFDLGGASLAMLPQSVVTPGLEDARRLAALLDALDDHDDVQAVYTNAELPEGVA